MKSTAKRGHERTDLKLNETVCIGGGCFSGLAYASQHCSYRCTGHYTHTFIDPKAPFHRSKAKFLPFLHFSLRFGWFYLGFR